MENAKVLKKRRPEEMRKREKQFANLGKEGNCKAMKGETRQQ